MIKEEIKNYLINFQKNELPTLIERELEIGKIKKIKSIIGPRRAGKTFFMYQEIKRLRESGIKKENILYLNFEDPKLIEVNFKEIEEIIKLHWQLYPASIKEKLHIFIDEPQNIKNWEIAVRALHDNSFDVYISGSSSKLLSKEIATSLRGRSISHILLPFSFREFLKMKETVFDIARLSSKEKANLLALFNEYLEYGGFPEIISENKENKIKIIKEYLDLIVYKDIVERYKIKNVRLIRWLINSLIASFSKEFSIHKIYLTLKSRGLRLSKNTLYSYFSMLEDSMFVYSLPKFNYSIRKKEFSINKAYLCDMGFTKIIEISKDSGRKIENIVFLELLKQKNKIPLIDIFYWKNQQQEEVDFVVKQGTKLKQLIQVCSDFSNFETKKREIRALIKASKELKCKNLVVITEDYEKEEIVEWFGTKRKIRIIPIWKWLLE